jgi:curli biogenesis system outer membrane secretion channel CsgG
MCGNVFAQNKDVDVEISDLAEKLAVSIKSSSIKKVTVPDFTDLQGAAQGELGSYLAEELTMDLVALKKDFAVLDRANLKKILSEHKLTASGLVDPENAKQLGRFAGVDALLIGTMIPKTSTVALNVKIITTETAEVVGAARAQFKEDDFVRKLATNRTPPGKPGVTEGTPTTQKKFGDLIVDMEPLKVVGSDKFELTVTLTNRNSRQSIWVALNSDTMGAVKSRISDTAGHEWQFVRNSNAGIPLSTHQRYGYDVTRFAPAAEIRPHDAITATLKFAPVKPTAAESGSYTLQMEILLGRNFDGDAGIITEHNIMQKMEVQ